jgi:hypothetical protein
MAEVDQRMIGEPLDTEEAGQPGKAISVAPLPAPIAD